MHWRALRYFDAVARCRSLRRAAAELHIAPTAISRQVDQLEHQLGAPLLERGPGGVELTAAGELLAAQAQHTLRDWARMAEHIGDLKGLRTGRVRLQVAEGVAGGLLVPALTNLSQRHERLGFQVDVASAGQVVTALRQGEADIGLAFFMPRHDDVVVFASSQLVQHAVMAPGHPLARESRLSVAALAEHTLALPGSAFGVRQTLEVEAADHQIALAPRFEVASLEAQKALACQGAAVLILPPMAIGEERAAGRLVSVPLREPSISQARLDLCYYRHRQPSFAMQACLGLLAETLTQLDEMGG